MPASPEERLATLEAHLSDLRNDFNSHLADAKSRSERVREMERAVGLMIEAQKIARRQEETQYRRLEIRIQWLVLSVALVGVAVTLAVALIHH